MATHDDTLVGDKEKTIKHCIKLLDDTRRHFRVAEAVSDFVVERNTLSLKLELLGLLKQIAKPTAQTPNQKLIVGVISRTGKIERVKLLESLDGLTERTIQRTAKHLIEQKIIKRTEGPGRQVWFEMA